RGRLASLADRAVDDWRDKRIAAIEPDSVALIAVERGKDRYTLQRAGKTWKLQGAPADSGAVARLLEKYRTVTAAGFASPAQADSARALRPARRLSVRSARGTTLVVLVFDSIPGAFWVRRTSGVGGGGEAGALYRMNAWDVDGLTAASGPPGERGTHDRGAAVLRVRAPGPEGPAARRHQRQAHGEHDHARGSGPGAGNGLSFPPAAGVLRHSGGSPLRGPRLRELLPPEAAARSRGRGARRRVGQDGAWVREAAQRVPGDHRQAASLGERR